MKKIILTILFFATSIGLTFSTNLTGKVKIKLCENQDILILVDTSINSDDTAEYAFILQAENTSYNADDVNQTINDAQVSVNDGYLIVTFNTNNQFLFTIEGMEFNFPSGTTFDKYFVGYGLSEQTGLLLTLSLPESEINAYNYVANRGQGGSGGKDCSNCSSGGTGATSCETKDLLGSCNVKCSGDFYACCNSSNNNCYCCPNTAKNGKTSGGQRISLFPNPSSGNFTVDLINVSAQDVTDLKVQSAFTNTTVYEKTSGFSSSMQLDLTLSTGYYVIIVYTQDEIFSLSFVINN